VKLLTMLRARLRPLRMPDDHDRAPLDEQDMRAFLALAVTWKDKRGTRAVAGRERHSEVWARRAAGRS
jgi:hypothetical protein